MPNKEEIACAIKDALLKKSYDAASIYEPMKNLRSYKCNIDGCERLAYAKGMCNAHYIRLRLGKKLTDPLRATRRDSFCARCGDACGSKGGWGLCPRHYKNERFAVIKDACISVFGGECSRCSSSFHRCVFDFHHVGKKDGSITKLISNASPYRIAEEMEKCILLCANCHRLEHFDNELS